MSDVHGTYRCVGVVRVSGRAGGSPGKEPLEPPRCPVNPPPLLASGWPGDAVM